jgi:dTDP-4-dehydrorhamnose 3,5-epimerase
VRRIATRLEGPLLLEPTVHGDARGFFLETFRPSTLAELGLHDNWVQDNHSRSARGVLRGMHFQPGMAKLVRCAEVRSLTCWWTSGRARRRSGTGRGRARR